MERKKKIKLLLIATSILIFIIGIIVFVNYFTSNTTFSEKEIYIKIPTGSSFENVKQIIKPYIKSENRFETMASLRSYQNKIKPGRFLFKNGMSSFEMVNSLRHNIPVKLAFNNQERMEDFVKRVSSEIEADSLSLMKTFSDSIFLKENGFTADNVFAMLIPNTYEMYWNTSAEKFRGKMINEYHRFWTPIRIEQAKKNNLTPIQAAILASIVHKESVKKDERPKIAAVYLNRIKLGMPLQADPTIIYALKKESGDFNQIIKRVIPKDLTIKSPYNTYLNIGLPPAPIAMPDITALEAVLNPDKNDYLFFCASVERFGYHEFAKTFKEHVIIANKYRDWINSKGVNR